MTADPAPMFDCPDAAITSMHVERSYRGTIAIAIVNVICPHCGKPHVHGIRNPDNPTHPRTRGQPLHDRRPDHTHHLQLRAGRPRRDPPVTRGVPGGVARAHRKRRDGAAPTAKPGWWASKDRTWKGRDG
jgi:hypothetical protein